MFKDVVDNEWVRIIRKAHNTRGVLGVTGVIHKPVALDNSKRNVAKNRSTKFSEASILTENIASDCGRRTKEYDTRSIRGTPMLNGESIQDRFGRFAGLKGDHGRARFVPINDGLFRTALASDRDRFAVEVDILKVSAWRHQDDIGSVSHINRLPDGWLIGRDVNYRPSGSAG